MNQGGEKRMGAAGKVKIGIQGYEIKQGLDASNMNLNLIFSNPEGSCQTYAEFIKKFELFLKDNGYSFKS